MELLHQPKDIIRQRYRIIDILGQGGSGTTYRAQDLQSDQQVALKALSLRHIGDWKTLELFEREARVLAQLNHPAIPQYLDYFHIDTPDDLTLYIIQHLAPGKPLAILVQNKWRASEAEVRHIAIQLLDILIYLHSLTPPVTHRDIKPQNIIRDTDGRMYLVDFGAVQDTYYNTFMRGSTVVGTYGYMAPEQFRGQAVPASDLYSLGATLLFLLTHRSPAELPTDRLKIDFRSHILVSQDLTDWLEKMLEPDVEERFSSAKEALAVLQGKRRLAAKYSTPMSWNAIAKMGIGAIATVAAVIVLNHFKYPILSSLGFTPRAMYEGIMNGNIETVRYYLDQGVNVNARDFRGSSPLHWAVTNNNKELVQLLIARAADIHVKYNENSHTVLHMAVQHDTSEVAELLIAEGADVNARDIADRTPLHLAIRKYGISKYYGMTLTSNRPSIETVKLLIDKGAEVNARDIANQTPLNLAVTQGYWDVVQLLRLYGGTE